MANFIPRMNSESGTFLHLRWLFQQQICPHCQRSETLKSHGFLRSCHDKLRGLRLFCSNRNSNKGCGRTHSIYFDDVIANCSLDFRQVSRIIERVLKGGRECSQIKNVSRGICSQATAYRWIRKTKLAQAALRYQACKLEKPPRGEAPSPLARTWRHLHSAFPNTKCILSAFQRTLQVNPYQPGATRFPISYRSISKLVVKQPVATRNENPAPPYRGTIAKSGFSGGSKESAQASKKPILAKQRQALLGSNLPRDSQTRGDGQRRESEG